MDMEKSVTSRVERALTLAGKIEHQESRTIPGAAVIKVFFQPGADASSAMNDIVNLEASDMFHLPPGIEWPFTLRSEPSNLPVVLAAISGEGLSESELYSIGYYGRSKQDGWIEGCANSSSVRRKVPPDDGLCRSHETSGAPCQHG